ncbi:choloylglycine hydrolase, partial [Klebsiella pneumoniae]
MPHTTSVARSALALAAAALLTLQSTADACTRLVYLGSDGNVITARSMDWKNDIATNLWVLPRGVARSG